METTFAFFRSHVLFDMETVDSFKSFVLGPLGSLLGFRAKYIKTILERPFVEPERELVQTNRFPNRNSVKGVAAYG